MNKKVLLIIFVLFSIIPFQIQAQVNIQDSLALVDYYDSTYGISPWQFGQSWDLQQPVNTWNGIGVRNNRVVSITFRGGGHGGHIPSSFGDLTALESMDYLDFMLDATLPESFSSLVNLRSLKMHAVFYMVPFPTAVTRLPNLTNLDFEDNLFTDSLPSSIGNMNQLTSLDVGNCFVNRSRIPSELGNLKNLNTLLLNNNHFYGAISDFFSNIDSLSGLDISSNNLSGNIPEGITELKKLNYLSLNDNLFTFQELEPFAEQLNGRTEKIEYLKLTPQALLKIKRYEEKLSVSAGGTLSNNTYTWYNVDDKSSAAINGDSTYVPKMNGKYYVDVTNSIAGVSLSSDTINCDYILPDTTTTVVHKIVDFDITYVNVGIIRLAAIKPVKDANALQGDVKVTVGINATFPTIGYPVFVDRHYDITPVVNDENAKAMVTLYFLQEDFDKFNKVVTDNNLGLALMPTAGVDNGHITVHQFHGIYDSTTGRYTGSTVQINPTVVWNPVNQWWEVSFPVSGFSGFYLSTASKVLPLTLLNFKGKKENNSVILQWQSSGEINTKQFIVQVNNGDGFRNIGTVAAQSIREINNYSFADENPKPGSNWYRLKMEDMDGGVTYSNVLNISFSVQGMSFKVYPNPSSSILNLKISGAKSGIVRLRITNTIGQTVYTKIFSVNDGDNLQTLNIEKMPAGNYYLHLLKDGKVRRIGFVKE